MKPKVFVFGSANDTRAWEAAGRIGKDLPEVEFIKTDNPDDIAAARCRNLIIMDAARGISEPRLLGIDDLKKRSLVTLHDMDLGMTLQILQRMKKIRNVVIVGIPLNNEVDVDELRAVLKTALSGVPEETHQKH